jgi:outer membrane receptor for ferric coprogen and ferric-rhodotorulic acid
MNKIIASAAALALVATAGIASAETYGSIGVQNSKTSKSDSSLNSINARVGKKITPHFGVEGEAAVGTNSDTNATGTYKQTHRLGAYAVGYLPVTENIELIGRAGVSNTRLKRPEGVNMVENGNALDYGVGAQYKVNDTYAVRGDYTRSEYREKHGDSDTVSLNLVRKF